MIGDVIKKERLKKDITQSELAKVIGVSPSTIGMYEQNRRQPDSESLMKIANYFQISVDYLLGISNNIHKEENDTYAPVDDVEKAMDIILEQPGLMLKGTILSDESKIILANAIQMGLRTAEELEKKKIEGDSNEG